MEEKGRRGGKEGRSGPSAGRRLHSSVHLLNVAEIRRVGCRESFSGRLI